MDPYAWSWSSHALVLVPALTIAYFWALRRVPAPRWRIACWLASMVLLLAVSVTPIETISLHYLLSVHLLQNVVLAEWAPLLAVLGIPPALAARAPRVPPLLALALWLVNYGVWHLPWIYDAALRHQHSLLHLEHVLYFATGVLLWWPIVHGDLISGREGGLPLRRVRAREPDRPDDGARARADLRLLRRRAAALGAVADPRPADRRRLDGGSGGGRLLRGLRVLLRALLRRAGRGRLRPNVTSMNALRKWLGSLFGTGSEPGSSPEPDRRAGSDRRAGDDRRSSFGEPRAASEERRERRRPPLRHRPPQQLSSKRAPLLRPAKQASFEVFARRASAPRMPFLRQ